MSLSKDSNESAARALGDLVRDAAESAETTRRSSMSARRHDTAARQQLAEAIRGRASFWARLAESLRALFGARRAWLGLGLAAVAVCAAVLVFRGGRLGYRVDGADDRSGYIRAEGHTVSLRFDDGSTFAFASGSAGRVSDVSSHGASVVLEDGVVEASVVHRSGAAWSALAGPWEVRVTGTRFDLGWDPRTHALRVDLWDGRVVVRGPGAEEGIPLHAGQSLTARDGEGIHVGSIERSASAASARSASAPSAAALRSPPVEASAAIEPSPASASAKAAAEPSSPAAPPADKPHAAWNELVAKGKHDVVLAEARERGIPQVLASASAADLLALADAARYGADGAVAGRALQALRDRFAGTKAATDAAFLLGRMADDGGSSAAAIRWYDTHMAEGGSFSQEALGRKMIAVRKSRGDAAARAVATQYLGRYPKGPHASVARALTEGDVAMPR